MSYTPPEMVLSPKGRIQDLEVVYDRGEGKWSVATMKWDGEESVGIRWNGGTSDNIFPGIGNPQSRGIPTWFILPSEVAEAVLEVAEKLKKQDAI